MNREETIEDFFSTFKTSINISSLYTPDHPYFVKSITEMKNKCDNMFAFYDVITVGFTPSGLIFDGKKMEKKGLFDDIARSFHSRKIKSLDIKKGVNLDELVFFFSSIAMRPAEIAKEGGIIKILDRQKLSNISVAELDYSALLKGSGEQPTDVWVYLLKEAVGEGAKEKINALVESFGVHIRKFHLKDFLSGNELQDDLNKFLQYLKDNNISDFHKCSQEICTVILKDSQEFDPQKFEGLAPMLDSIDTDDLAASLVQRLVSGEGLNSLNLKLFFKFIGPGKQKEIAISLAKKLKTQGRVSDSHGLKKRINELFSSITDTGVSDVYHQQLSSLIDDIVTLSERKIDHKEIVRNYRFILFDLLVEEKDQERLYLVIEKLRSELDIVIKEKDWPFLKFFLEAIERKIKLDPYLSNIFVDMYRRVSETAESLILSGDATDELRYLLKYINQAHQDVNSYLQVIFVDNRNDCDILELFFKFFPGQTSSFNNMLDMKIADTEFMLEAISNLKNLNYQEILKVYAHIFDSGSDFLKSEVIKALRAFAYKDEEFLLSIVRRENFILKKEAVITLKDIGSAESGIIEALFSKRDFLGLNNKIFIENMDITEAADLRGAKDKLISFSKRRFFWNKALREKAAGILRKWNAG